MPPSRTAESIRHHFTGPVDQCWYLPHEIVWDKGNGYAYVTVEKRRVGAHRLAYELFVGPIPVGAVIDHQCHNLDLSCPGGDTCPHRRCVNPAHLRAVDTKTNVLAGRGPVAENARKETCPRGHPYVTTDGGRRHCPICRFTNRIATGDTSGTGHVGTRTHCPAGHEYTEENTYRYKQHGGKHNGRMCKTCVRTRARDRQRRLKAIPPERWKIV